MSTAPEFAFDVCHEVYVGARSTLLSKLPTGWGREGKAQFNFRPQFRPRLQDFIADFERTATLALREHSSRLGLFEQYFIGGGDWDQVRRRIGISPVTFTDWRDEIRRTVGKQLLRSVLFPPRKYFSEPGKMDPMSRAEAVFAV